MLNIYQTSNARNAEKTTVKLTIGQCKVIDRLLDEKLYEIEAGLSDLNENAFRRLVDVFMKAVSETDEEKAINDVEREEIFRKWASGGAQWLDYTPMD